MAPLTTGNYFDQVKKVNFSKAPGALQRTHELVKKVGTGSDAWVNYNESAQIKSTIDKHFELMGKYLAAHPELQVKAAPAPKAAKPAKAAKRAAAPKAAKLPKSSKEFKFSGGDTVEFEHNGLKILGNVQPYTGGPAKPTVAGKLAVWVPSQNRELDLKSTDLKLYARFADRAPHKDMLPSGRSKPAAAPKAAKPAKASKPAKAVLPEIEYFNGNGKLVKGRVDAEKLYYVQPDGSYKQGGDAHRSTGSVKPPKAKKVKATKAPKAAKPVKVKPVDTRTEVPQLSGEVLLMQAFLKIEGKSASIEQIRALHRRMEKDFTKHKVRSTSKHADVLRGIAGTVAALYSKMTAQKISSIAKLEFKSADTKQLADKAKAIVGNVRVGTATTLLSAFVNMQGTVPTEKAATNLRTKLENEFEEHPDGDFALAVGAAAAVLKDWKPGTSVRITKQQLSGLAGLMDLGCPDTPPGKACGCSAAPKKARR